VLAKLLYGITALILALALGGFAVQTARLSKAENRAVEATKLAGEYQRSLEGLERAVAAQAKSDKAARELLDKRAKVAEAQAAKAKKERKELEDALKANADWASQPIPPGVLDSISNR
jgi:biopolymer transport protein ExbB/TolQ